MGVIQCQLLWFFVTKPEVNFLTKNDYHCAKLVRNQYFIKKIKVLFLDSNYNESITEGTNQFSLKKFKVHCFDQKGQKSTVHFFASTKGTVFFFSRKSLWSTHSLVFENFFWCVSNLQTFARKKKQPVLKKNNIFENRVC